MLAIFRVPIYAPCFLFAYGFFAKLTLNPGNPDSAVVSFAALPRAGFSDFFLLFLPSCSYKIGELRKWVLDAMLEAGFKSSPPGDWVKSLRWKHYRLDILPLGAIRFPATGLSRFVGNRLIPSASLIMVYFPATGLSRFVGNPCCSSIALL